MFATRLSLFAVTIAIATAGCGSDTPDQPSTTSAAAPSAGATRLDGQYLAKLDRDTLRKALAPINPQLRLPGGWWTLLIDGRSDRLVLSHPFTGAFNERVTAVRDTEIWLAPSLECEQRGPSRTQPSRLAWFTSGGYLRFRAIDVPCLTTNALLTSTLWRKA